MGSKGYHKSRIKIDPVLLMLLFLIIGLFAGAFFGGIIFINKTVQQIGMISEILPPKNTTELINRVMADRENDMQPLAKEAFKNAGYKDSYFLLLFIPYIVKMSAVVLIFILIGIICFLIYKQTNKHKENEISRLVKWIKSDSIENEDFFLIHADVVSAVKDLKYRIKRSDQIHEEDSARLINYLEDITHQLKTPLAVIRATNERTLLTYSDTAPILDKAISQIDKMSELISQFLLLGRFECGRIKAEFKEIQPNNIFETQINDHIFLANEHNMSIDVVKKSDIPWMCDEFWISQVISIIIENALKHGKDNGKIEIAYGSEETYNYFSISDDGTGFENGAERKIFERFSSEDRTGKGGAGLGLSIAKQAVSLHFGTITANNRAEGGTVFSVKFPKLDIFGIYGPYMNDQ